MNELPISIVVHPVDPTDQAAVLELLRPFVEQRKLLKRTIDELDALSKNGFVAKFETRVVGFATLEVYSRKLAEVRALVVAEAYQGKGVGRMLVEACLQRARELDVMEVMAISSAEAFFLSCGFGFTLPDEKKAFFLQTGSRN